MAREAREARVRPMTSFGELYERYAPMVHGILIAMVAPHEAQDLAQDVFVRAFEKIGTLADPERVGPWLAAIARNAGRDALRAAAARGRPAPLQDDVAADRGRTSAGEVAAGEAEDVAAEARAALAALRSLPEAYRETLAMRLVEGLAGPEIARRTGLTPGSVRVNLTRGMKLLRERLGLGREEAP